MQSINDKVVKVYVDYYNENGEDAAYEWVLNSQMSISILTTLYDRFVAGGTTPIEKLPQEIKNKYWKIGCTYFDTLGGRMKAVKSVYVLNLVTTNKDAIL